MSRFYIHAIERSRWVDHPVWLLPERVPADALTNLRTKSNNLSVFEVGPDLASRGPAVVAIALSRSDPSKYAYVFLSDDRLRALQLHLVSAPHEGGTPDRLVNDKHFNIEKLDDNRLCEVATQMWALFHQHAAERIDPTPRELIELVAGSVARSRIDDSRVTEKKARKLLDAARTWLAERPPPGR